MLIDIYRCVVFCATLLTVQSQLLPRVVRVNGTAKLDPSHAHGRANPGRLGFDPLPPAEERPLLRAGPLSTKSQLQADVEHAKMLFDNFQELLVNGRMELGLPPSSYSTKDYTEGTSATTVQFTINNAHTANTTRAPTTSKKRFLRIQDMSPSEQLTTEPPTTNTTTSSTTETTHPRLAAEKLRDMEMNSEMEFIRNAFLESLDKSATDANGEKRRYHNDTNPNRDYESLKHDVVVSPKPQARKALKDPFQGTYELSRVHALGNNDSTELSELEREGGKPSRGDKSKAQFVLFKQSPSSAATTKAAANGNVQAPKPEGPKAVNGSTPHLWKSLTTTNSSRPTRIVKFMLQGNQTVTFTSKAVLPTTTATSQAPDDNGRYFSQFYPQLLEMISLKDNDEVGMLKGSLCAAVDMYHATGKFRFLNVLDNNLAMAADYLQSMPDDHVKELAGMADDLFRNNKMADDTRELVDFLNYIYTDKDADHMSLILYNVKNYLNRTSSVDVGGQIVRWLIMLPLKRISGDEPLLHAFVDVAMTFIERFRKPQELPHDIHRGRRGGVTQSNTTDPALRIEFTPLNLRRARPLAGKKRIQPQRATRQSQETDDSSSALYERDNSKQRRFLIVGRKDASQSARRQNGNKMAARRFKTVTRENDIEVPTHITSLVDDPAEADSLRKYLYDCVKRIMYRRT